MRLSRSFRSTVAMLAMMGGACSSSNSSSPGSGGNHGTGGGTSQGGTIGSGGATQTGSGGSSSTGGRTGAGSGGAGAAGQSGSGGAGLGGATTGAGGALGTGGSSTSGGSSAVGQGGVGGQTKPSTGAGGQGGGVDGGGQSDGGFFASNCTGTTWPTGDPTAPGPYKVTADKNVGPLAGAIPDPVYQNTQQRFNVYRPTTLGTCHPIILWGNGHGDNPEPNPPLCLASNYCGDYLTILNQLASHGFVVIASLSTITGTVDPTTNQLPQIVGMNWIVQQNDDPTSPYYQHLDPSHIGATGHSFGGIATSVVGTDPHVLAIATMAGTTVESKLNGPALYLCGGADTTVPCSNIQKAFDAITATPIMMEENPTASHGSWIGSIKDPYQVAVTAWMRVHLMGDTAIRNMFYGTNCQLCQNTQLKVQRKNMDQ